jgi:hypothetical protein
MEQQMARNDLPGFGDQASWPACIGHALDPRTDPDEEALTEDEALDIAEGEADRDGYSLALWLNNFAIIDHTGPADLASVRERIDLGEPCTASELLALAFNDGDKAAYCLHLLREQYRAHAETRDWVKGRAKELLAAQEEQEEERRIEALAMRYDAYAEAA